MLFYGYFAYIRNFWSDVDYHIQPHLTPSFWDTGKKNCGKVQNTVYLIIIIIFTLFCILSSLNFRKSVFQKLYDLYIEECEKEPEVKVSIKFLLLWLLECRGRGTFEADNGLYFCEWTDISSSQTSQQLGIPDESGTRQRSLLREGRRTGFTEDRVSHWGVRRPTSQVM